MHSNPVSRRLVLALLLVSPLPALAEEAPRRFMMENAATGEVVTDDIMLGKVSLLYFGYTHCPDVCPTSMVAIAKVMAELGAQADRVQPIFVTVDPDRDTTAVMSAYVKSFDGRIVPLRGPKAYTDAMVKAYNAKYEIQKAASDDPDVYTVDHTASIAMVGPDGLLIKRFPYGLDTAAMTAEVRAAVNAMPAP
jgi:protein SCO1/2